MAVRFALTMFVLLVTSACAPKIARLYSVDTATPPLELRYQRGRAWIGDQRTPTCQGEYKTSEAGLWGGTGIAVLNCQDGRVLDCRFEFSEWTGQGTGSCRDNRQQLYRVLF